MLTDGNKDMRDEVVQKQLAFAHVFVVVVVAVFIAGLFITGCQTDQSAVSRSEPVAPVFMVDHAMLDAMNEEERVILDVRTPGEYERGHIPGAINIPHNELSARSEELASHGEKTIVAYCESGGRTRIALDILKKAGYTRLGHLKGDMISWRTAGRALD